MAEIPVLLRIRIQLRVVVLARVFVADSRCSWHIGASVHLLSARRLKYWYKGKDGTDLVFSGCVKFLFLKQCMMSVNMAAFTWWIFLLWTYTHSCTITYSILRLSHPFDHLYEN